MRARTAHWPDAIIIEHDCPMKSHPSSAYVPEPILFDYGTGIHAALNIITSDCSIHHGRAAYAESRATHNNSTRDFLLTIQQQERGETGLTIYKVSDYYDDAGNLIIRRAHGTHYETFMNELANAGALEGADKHDDWGFEGTQLPQFKKGYRGPHTHYRDYEIEYTRLPSGAFTQVATPKHGKFEFPQH